VADPSKRNAARRLIRDFDVEGDITLTVIPFRKTFNPAKPPEKIALPGAA
jgi:hypothetical protein